MQPPSTVPEDARRDEPTALQVPGADAPEVDEDAAEPASPGLDSSALEPPRVAIDADAEQRRLLSLRLEKVNAEIDSTSTLFPWIAVVTGAALLLTGVTVGSIKAIDCTGSCSAPFWPSWAVTGGATIGIGGLVWLRLTEVELSYLGTRRYQLQRDIDRLEMNGH